MAKKVFIISNPRSGSTLLASIFEHNGYVNLGENRWLWSYVMNESKSVLLFRLYRGAVRRFLLSKTDGRSYVEKTPSVIGYLKGYLRLLPEDAVVIYVHRNFSDYLPSAYVEWLGNFGARKSHDSRDVREGTLWYALKKLTSKNNVLYRILRPYFWPTFLVTGVSLFGFISRVMFKRPFVFGLFTYEVWVDYFLNKSVKWIIWRQWRTGVMNLKAFSNWDGDMYKIEYDDILTRSSRYLSLCESLGINPDVVPLRQSKIADKRYDSIDSWGKSVYDSI